MMLHLLPGSKRLVGYWHRFLLCSSAAWHREVKLWCCRGNAGSNELLLDGNCSAEFYRVQDIVYQQTHVS